jgi:hypothetical protein
MLKIQPFFESIFYGRKIRYGTSTVLFCFFAKAWRAWMKIQIPHMEPYINRSAFFVFAPIDLDFAHQFVFNFLQ